MMGVQAEHVRDNDSCGLSELEAARRLRRDGPNTIAKSETRRWTRIVADGTREPMFLLLVVAALLYLLLGKLGEGLFLCLMVGVTLGLTWYQEGKTERALAALRRLGSPRAIVVRDGRRRRVPGSALVVGDVIEIGEGDRIPADALLLAAYDLQVDESLLSGESLPLAKVAGRSSGMASVYAGSLVLQGHGVARVESTGAHSKIGAIGVSLRTVEMAPSPLRSQMVRLANRFAVLGLMLCVLLTLVDGIVRGDWMQALLAGIALAMSMLPEELAVVMTVFPAMGAWRLSHQQVLMRRVSAIDALGKR